MQKLRREELQDFLEAKAEKYSGSVVRHLRWFLNAIFKLAVSDGMLLTNPAGELRIPRRCKPGRSVRSLSESEVASYLAALGLREALIARFAIFEGMRPGEILADRWSKMQEDKLLVDQRVYRGKFDTPKNGKTREVAISPGTLQLLNQWRALSEKANCGGFVFPSEKNTTPISLDNLWRRSMKPRLDKVGLGWATFQVLRKTNATLLKKYGADAKVSADQRGHGIGVSLEIYTNSDIAQKSEAVRKLDEAIKSVQERQRVEAQPKVA